MSQARLNIVRAMAAMAWSDGRMDKKEMEKIRLLAKRVGLDANGRSKAEGFLRSRTNLEGMSFEELNDKERSALYLMAAHYAYMDGRIKPGEQKVLDKLAELLAIAPDAAAQLVQSVRDQKK